MSLSLHPTRVAATALLLPALAAHAARPLVTEDAAILARGYCQLETWAQHNDNSTDYWAAPHCNVGGNWELIAALGQLGAPGEGEGHGQRSLRAKTILRPMAKDDWAVGLVLADQFGAGDGIDGDVALTIPLSVSLFNRRLLVHANAGWLRRRSGPFGMTWALAGEWNVTTRAGFTLEAYGAGHDHSYLQAGARYDLVPRRVTLDAAIGNRFGVHRAERYIAIGLTVTADVLR
jgi:hypothetical protein